MVTVFDYYLAVIQSDFVTGSWEVAWVVESLWVMSISEQPWRKEKAHDCYGAVVITFEMQKASSAPQALLMLSVTMGEGREEQNLEEMA